MDAQGTVDLEEKTLSNMDVVIASLHTPCMKPASRQKNTESQQKIIFTVIAAQLSIYFIQSHGFLLPLPG